MTDKIYSAASSVHRAAKRQGLSKDQYFAKVVEGGFILASLEEANRAAEEDKFFIDATGYSHCPECGIHLSNGYTDFEGTVESMGSRAKAFEAQKHEFSCLGCGGEWGEEIAAPAPRKAPASRQSGERDRSDPELVRPTKMVWEIAEKMKAAAAAAGEPAPKRKEVVAACIEAGIAAGTSRTQYQHWFKASKASS